MMASKFLDIGYNVYALYYFCEVAMICLRMIKDDILLLMF